MQAVDSTVAKSNQNLNSSESHDVCMKLCESAGTEGSSHLQYDSSKEDLQSSDVLHSSEPVHYFTALNADELQQHLTEDTSLEVATFVTEDGHTGQIVISGQGAFQNGSHNAGIVALGDTDISTLTSMGRQLVSLGSTAADQLATLTGFRSSGLSMSTVQAGDNSYEYIMKDESRDVATQFAHTMTMSGMQSEGRKTFKCAVQSCGKQFGTQYRLKAHNRTHTGDTFNCNIDDCQKSFNTASDLQKHVKTHCGQKNFFCDIDGCGKEYSTAHHLKVHKRAHSGERPFSCDWENCGKMFSTSYGLKSHFRTHTNERPYKCQEDHCNKSFKTSGDLMKHVRTHTGERPFRCSFEGCDRTFTTSNIRKVHYRTHTGEKPYKCEIEGCGRSFASATNFKNHSRIHTGERPYFCEVPGCLKRFTEYSSLYKHNIVHTQQKPYTCSLCRKTYRQTSTLAMHKRTVHGTDDIFDEEEEASKGLSDDGMPSLRAASGDPQSSSYLQSVSLVINPINVDSSFAGSLQQGPSGTGVGAGVTGAIAIPIQVAVNVDGTISRTQSISLTDASGRVFPLNLSVSIPLPASGSSDVALIEEVAPSDRGTSGSEDEDSRLALTSEQIQSVASEHLFISRGQNNVADPRYAHQNRTRTPEGHVEIKDEGTEDEGDVTAKYLTSHYVKS